MEKMSEASEILSAALGGFQEHKSAAVELSREILPRSVWFADRRLKIDQCGTFIRLQADAENSASMQLVASNLCRLRLCPMCEWRLSLRRFVALQAAVDQIGSASAWLHLVLTTPNVSGDELSSAITALFGRFRAFWKKSAPPSWLGFYRGLEVTYNAEEDTYHPHFHVLVSVRESYFKSRDYLSQAALQDLWGSIVFVKRIRDLGSGIAEVVKYACKPLRVSDRFSADRAAAVYDVLAGALHGRRMVQAGGNVQEALRTLGRLAELNELTEGTDQTDEARESFGFYWHFKENKYVPISGQEV